MKPVYGWVGVRDDKIHRTAIDDEDYGNSPPVWLVFTNRGEAKRRYERVERVEVRLVPVKPKRKPAKRGRSKK